MGEVFKARHQRMDRIVAIKVLSREATAWPESVKRFEREVRAAAKLMHPNIVTALDAGEEDGLHYLVMEYVDGEDLSEFARQNGPLPVERVVDCILQAAHGLEYAHSQGIIHRDIKPRNLLIDKAGTVKILDMGLARLPKVFCSQSKETLTIGDGIFGTCDYIAPEQADDPHSADRRADIYSLGCTLYCLLIGEPPFQRKTAVQTVLAHREDPVPSLRRARADVTTALDAVFQRMLAKSPKDRHPSMTEVIAELGRCVAVENSAQSPISVTSPDDCALKSFIDRLPPEVAAQPQRTAARRRKSPRQTEINTAPSVESGRGGQGRDHWRKVIVSITVGGVAVCFLVGLIIFGAFGTNGQRGPASKQQNSLREAASGESDNPSETCLIIYWSATERRGATLKIDGEVREIGQYVDGAGRTQVPLAPGEHRIRIDRPQHEPFEGRLVIASGESLIVEPVWQPSDR
jgi:serine/threonine protein kinase